MSMTTIPSALPLSANDAATLARMPEAQKAKFVAAAVSEKLDRESKQPAPTISRQSVGSDGPPSTSAPNAIDLEATESALLARKTDKASFIAAAIREKMKALPPHLRTQVTTPPPAPRGRAALEPEIGSTMSERVAS